MILFFLKGRVFQHSRSGWASVGCAHHHPCPCITVRRAPHPCHGNSRFVSVCRRLSHSNFLHHVRLLLQLNYVLQKLRHLLLLLPNNFLCSRLFEPSRHQPLAELLTLHRVAISHVYGPIETGAGFPDMLCAESCFARMGLIRLMGHCQYGGVASPEHDERRLPDATAV